MVSGAIAILISVPTSLDGLVNAVRIRSDYARRYADDPGRHWSMPGGYRARVAEPLLALARQATALGVRVTFDACRNDLAAATLASEVVVTVAHWKGARVSNGDLTGAGSDQIAATLRASHDGDLRALARVAQRVPPRRPERLVQCLNKMLETLQRQIFTNAEKSHDGIRGVMSKDLALTYARQRLDRELMGLLAPGERLELADGLHDVEAVDQAISKTFGGVLDLTTCTSVLLADQLDKRRKGSFRTVQFDQSLPPEVASLALRQTLSVFERGHAGESGDAFRYLAARKAAIEDVSHALSAAAKNEMRRTSPWRLFGRNSDKANAKR